MARRDLTSFPSHDLPGLAGGAAAPPGADDLDSALREGLGRMRQVALSITRDAAAADDVLQSALEKALRNRARFRGEAKASTWLHRIVVNEALMWHRSERSRAAKEARLGETQALERSTTSTQPLAALLARERDEGMRHALRALRPEDADLLAHCHLEERDYASWARRAGMEAMAAKTRAFRARRALRAALEAAEA